MLNRRPAPLPRHGERFDPPVIPPGAEHATLALAFGLTPEEAIAAAEPKPEMRFPQQGDRLHLVRGPHRGECLRPEMLEPGDKPLEVMPFDPASGVLRKKNRLNRMLVIRVAEEELDASTRKAAVEGLLAFAVFCDERACAGKTWRPEEQVMRCDCRVSEFAAIGQAGEGSGLARRRPPMVPLGVDEDGFVVALKKYVNLPRNKRLG